MAYVYRHIRLDKNVPFYIGVGTDNNYFRANQKSKTKRSEYWHNIVNKTNYRVEILIDKITDKEAFDKEIEFISLYGRADLGNGTLVNLTNGGENPPKFFGDKNPMKLKQNRDKLSNKMKGRKFSESHKKSMSESRIALGQIPPSRLGIKRTKEECKKQSDKIKRGLHCNAKKIICTKTNKVWNCIKDCSEDNNIKYSSLTQRLNGFRKNNTTFVYL